MEDLILINHVGVPNLQVILHYKAEQRQPLNSVLKGSKCLFRTMFLVPQESTLNSNKTVDPSVCLGPHAGSNRLVLSDRTEGKVEDRVATTVMVPSVEQTETRGSTGTV